LKICFIDFTLASDYLSQAMFDEELPLKKTNEFPRNLDGLSIAELQDYIEAMKCEIARVEENIDKKKASADAAASVFK